MKNANKIFEIYSKHKNILKYLDDMLISLLPTIDLQELKKTVEEELKKTHN